MKRYFFQVPAHVSYAEAAALYEFMAKGETTKTEYLDKRNQQIFDSLETLIQQEGLVGTRRLCEFMDEYSLLSAAGGLAYVKKVFNHLEPLEAVC